MSVCPLCEHVQESGIECDVCGRRLGADPSGEAAPAVTLEGLEPTQSAPAEVDSALLADLDPTALAPAPPPPGSDLASSAACRYCGRAGAPGEAFCPSCGVALPRIRTPASLASASEPGRRLCSDCGVPVDGEACPACGARHGGV